MKIAIIGGSGFSSFPWAAALEPLIVHTGYGEVELQKGKWMDREFFFLPRHGREHEIPPHRINYRANIMALAELGVKWVLATAAVGSLKKNIPPGTLVLLDQFLDFTKARPFTFFNGEESGVRHIDYTVPYCGTLREIISGIARNQKGFKKKGCYVCTEGPRYETPAEVRMFAGLGGDVVGMTNIPEVTLSRELGLCYCALAIVTNFGAGLSKKILSHQDVERVMAENIARVGAIFEGVLKSAALEEDCKTCPH